MKSEDEGKRFSRAIGAPYIPAGQYLPWSATYRFWTFRRRSLEAGFTLLSTTDESGVEPSSVRRIAAYDFLQQAARTKVLIHFLIVSPDGIDAVNDTRTAAQNEKALDHSPVLRVYAVR
jgi:hypothetical protein